MRRKDIDGGHAARLYLAGVSVRAIALELGCSEGPVYRVLSELGVRVSRRADIDPVELERLYAHEHRPMRELGAHYGVSSATVRKHLLTAGIPIRTHAESLQPTGRRPCPQSLTYRSYALGFVWGDLAAERLSDGSLTIAVRGSTTRPEQLAVVEEVFAPFGRVAVSNGPNSSCVRASLDLSFEFLLDKYTATVPTWVSGPAPAAAFAGGYIDAEGSFGVYDRRGRFKLDSYDETVHAWLSRWLGGCGIIHVTRPISISGAGQAKGDVARGGALWRTTVNEALSLLRLIATIEPFTRHARRRETMSLVAENVRSRLRSRDVTLESPEHRNHQPRGPWQVDAG